MTVTIAAPLISSANQTPNEGPINRELLQTSYGFVISE